MAPQRRKSAKSQQRFSWRDVSLSVTATPNYLHDGWTHLELRVRAPKTAPLPLTQTGYLSHFIDADELVAAGGAVAFFCAWLEREAKSKRWQATEFRWRQGDLFQRR